MGVDGSSRPAAFRRDEDEEGRSEGEGEGEGAVRALRNTRRRSEDSLSSIPWTRASRSSRHEIDGSWSRLSFPITKKWSEATERERGRTRRD